MLWGEATKTKSILRDDELLRETLAAAPDVVSIDSPFVCSGRLESRASLMPSRNSSGQKKSDPLCVAIAGRMGAGKTSAAKYLSSRYGFQYARYSQVLAEWLPSEASDRHQLQRFGWEVTAGGRQVELNARLLSKLDRSRSAVVDGLRHKIDFCSLEYAFESSLVLLFIEAPEKLRFGRLQARFPNLQAFQAADSQPVEAHIDDLKQLATAGLSNDGSREDLYRRLDGWITAR